MLVQVVANISLDVSGRVGFVGFDEVLDVFELLNVQLFDPCRDINTLHLENRLCSSILILSLKDFRVHQCFYLLMSLNLELRAIRRFDNRFEDHGHRSRYVLSHYRVSLGLLIQIKFE